MKLNFNNCMLAGEKGGLRALFALRTDSLTEVEELSLDAAIRNYKELREHDDREFLEESWAYLRGVE